jgi:dolichol kinase
MNENMINTIYLAAAFLALFASAEFAYRKLKIEAELTRKYVHLLTGLLTLLFPVLIGDPWLVLLLCGSFLLILTVSLIFGLLPSINAVGRITRGSILYPIIVYCTYRVFLYHDQYIFYYIPILVMAVCDPLAALAGKKWPYGAYQILKETKTLMGASVFFVSASIVTFLLILSLSEILFIDMLIISISTALCAAAVEAASPRGWDNLTIPVVCIAVLLLFKNYTSLL